MPVFEVLDSPDDFSGGYYVDWFEQPAGLLVPVCGYTAGNCRYDLENLTLTVDVSGPAVELSVCSQNRVRGQFRRGDPVLLADCHPTQKPLRLTFAPPVRAVGAYVGAEGLAGQNYDAVLNVADAATGNGQGRNVRATLSNQVGTAPFLGLRSPAGTRIGEAWFDALSADAATVLQRVAIGPLSFLL